MFDQSDKVLEWCIPIAVVGVAWLLAFNALEFGITKVFWDKRWRGPLWIPELLKISKTLLPIGVAGLMFLSLNADSGSSTHWPSSAWGLVGLLVFIWVPTAAVQLCARAWSKKRIGSSGKLVEATSRGGFLTRLSSRGKDVRWLWPLFIIGVVTLPFPWSLLLSAACLVSFFSDNFRRNIAAPVAMIEMDDVPLHAEIRNICEGFDRRLGQLFISMRPDPKLLWPIPLLDMEVMSGRSRKRLVVPAINLQELNPSSFTAALSWYFARNQLWSPRLGLLLGTALNAYPLLIMLIAIVCLIIGLAVNHPNQAMLLAYAYIAVIALLVTASLLARVYVLVTRTDAYAQAFQVWRNADTSGDRDVTGYICALAEHLAFEQHIGDAALVRHQIQLDAGLMRFVRHAGADNPLQVIQQAESHVRQWLER